MEYVINIRNLINNIKSNSYSGIRDTVKDFVKMILEKTLYFERQKQLGCPLYARSQNRMDYANSSYLCTISTSYGYINDLRVPRLMKN